jgi:nitric oxide reductase NorQ protein
MGVQFVDNTKNYNIGINDNFVASDFIMKTTERAISYLNSGFPVHLRGAAGVGKTSLAFFIANKIGRPIIFISGSEEVNDSNLIGGFFGIKTSFLEDNYISSVYKKEEQIKKTWNDGKLLTACKNGYTVIYDEFTRARPEVNNVLMTILEEKVVDIPYKSSADDLLQIHSDFRIIFTSNPEEYAGVYKSANALIDRMVTIDMDTMDTGTEKGIIIAKSGIGEKNAERIMRMTRFVKNQFTANQCTSLRSSIMLAKVIKTSGVKMDPSNEMFRQICRDIYNSLGISLGLELEKKRMLNSMVDKAIDMFCVNT